MIRTLKLWLANYRRAARQRAHSRGEDFVYDTLARTPLYAYHAMQGDLRADAMRSPKTPFNAGMLQALHDMDTHENRMEELLGEKRWAQ